MIGIANNVMTVSTTKLNKCPFICYFVVLCGWSEF